MIYPFDKLLLTWRKGAGHRRRVVGELSLSSDNTPTFTYLDEKNLQVAREEGFRDYPGLPYKQSINQEVALDLFYRRLINTERNDAHRLLNFLCVDTNRIEDKLYLLGITTGQSATDHFEFLPILKPTEQAYDFVTEVAGLTHYNFDLETIQEGDILPFRLEPDNEQDPKAVAITSHRGEVIGYIKRGINEIFHAQARVVPYVHRILQGKYPSLFLRLHIEAETK